MCLKWILTQQPQKQTTDVLYASHTSRNILLVNLENKEEKSEGLEELSNPKLGQVLSYGDGKMTKDRDISS